MLAVPIYLLQIYDKVIPNNSTDSLLFLTGIVVIAIATLGLLEMVRRKILTKLGIWFEHQLGEHLLHSSLARAVKRNASSADILRDLERIRNFFSSSTLITLLDLPWTPVYLFVLFYLHPSIGWLVTLGSTVLMILAIANEAMSRQLVKEADTSSRDAINTASGFVQNADVIHAMGMQRAAIQHWKRKNNDALNNAHQASSNGARLLSIAKFVRLTLQIGVVFLTAWLILKGELSPGATIACLLLMRRAVGPFEQMISSWRSVLHARAAFDNISLYLDKAPDSIDEIEQLPAPNGALHVDSLLYKRRNATKSLLNRCSFSVEPGQAIAITGATAVGKSTLAQLLMGLLTPNKGRIALDGFNLLQWPAAERSQYIGYLPQEVSLIRGTVAENIARLQAVDLQQVIEAAQRAHAHELIIALPEGYDTDVGSRGFHLSGGQKQRIALARAVYGQPKLVILDEPDANLDNDGKIALAATLNRLKNEGAIVVLITHNRALCQFVNRTYELKDGRLQQLSISRATPSADRHKTSETEKSRSSSRSRRSRSSSSRSRSSSSRRRRSSSSRSSRSDDHREESQGSRRRSRSNTESKASANTAPASNEAHSTATAAYPAPPGHALPTPPAA